MMVLIEQRINTNLVFDDYASKRLFHNLNRAPNLQTTSENRHNARRNILTFPSIFQRHQEQMEDRWGDS